MERITSAQNAKVKRVKELLAQSKARRRAGEFVCEGRRLCEEIPPELIREVWMSESFAERERDLPEDVRTFVVPDSLFRSVSDTAGPQGMLAVVRMPEQARSGAGPDPCAEQAGPEPRVILMLEGLQDPGNLGTIFRTAEAAGVGEIVMDRGCADVFSPKVVRATMGSVFRVPFSICEDLPALAASMVARGRKVFAACLGAETDYRDADFTGDCAILIGNEGNGLTEAALSAATERVIIPMQGEIESLNASVAAALLMYEAGSHAAG